MRICLVRPPAFLNPGVFPLNIGSIAAILKKASHDVIFVDGELIAHNMINQMNKRNKIIKLRDKVFSQFRVNSIEHIVDSFFSGETLWEAINERIVSCRPDLIGFSCYTASMSSTKALTERLKNYCGVKVPIILGGIHPTTSPSETLAVLPWVDFIVIGEGEQTLIELAHAIENKDEIEHVDGICFRKNGTITFTKPRTLIKDMSGLPLTELNLAHAEYTDYVLLTSRGCPFSCDFCASKLMWGKRVRFRKPEDVAQEVAFLREKRGIRRIRFGDDTFTLNLKHIKDISNALRKTGIHDVRYSIGSRIDTIDEDKLAVLKEMGVYRISIGVESGSQKILNNINKNIELANVIPVVKMINEAGIFTLTFFIINHPRETIDDMADSMKLISHLHKECKLNISLLNTGFPYPGTEWWLYCIENNILDNIDIYNYSHKYNHQQTPAVNMTSEPIATLIDMRNRINRKATLCNLRPRLTEILDLIRNDPKRLLSRVKF